MLVVPSDRLHWYVYVLLLGFASRIMALSSVPRNRKPAIHETPDESGVVQLLGISSNGFATAVLTLVNASFMRIAPHSSGRIMLLIISPDMPLLSAAYEGKSDIFDKSGRCIF